MPRLSRLRHCIACSLPARENCKSSLSACGIRLQGVERLMYRVPRIKNAQTSNKDYPCTSSDCSSSSHSIIIANSYHRRRQGRKWTMRRGKEKEKKKEKEHITTYQFHMQNRPWKPPICASTTVQSILCQRHSPSHHPISCVHPVQACF